MKPPLGKEVIAASSAIDCAVASTLAGMLELLTGTTGNTPQKESGILENVLAP